MIDLIWSFGECFKNCLLDLRVNQKRYPDRWQPNKNTLQKLLDRFIVLSVKNPHTGVRNISRE